MGIFHSEASQRRNDLVAILLWPSLTYHLFKGLYMLINALCKDGVEKPKCKIGTKSSFNEVPIEVITDMLRMLIHVFSSTRCNKEYSNIIRKEKKLFKTRFQLN